MSARTLAVLAGAVAAAAAVGVPAKVMSGATDPLDPFVPGPALLGLAEGFGDAQVMRFGPGPQARDRVERWLRGRLGITTRSGVRAVGGDPPARWLPLLASVLDAHQHECFIAPVGGSRFARGRGTVTGWLPAAVRADFKPDYSLPPAWRATPMI